MLITQGVVTVYPVFSEYWNSFGSLVFTLTRPCFAGLRVHPLIDRLYSHFGSYAPRASQLAGQIIFGYTVLRVTRAIFLRVFRFHSSI